MCGIAGAFALDGRSGRPLERHVLQRMTEVIKHRGPDDAGLVLGDGVALGARRLSIIDVAGGHQPLSDERGLVWGAQNGEIYNHDQLRDELTGSGHAFRSRCDTEVLPHLYEEHGPALCERLHGKYAIAVWDAGARNGLLARDRLGVKPLYYAVKDGLVLFGSELKCLIASGLVSDTLDPEAIAAYLTLGSIPGPMTPLREVRKVMPGERLLVGDGELRRERYWRYPVPQPDTTLDEREWTERVLAGLDDAVGRRLMSDVPLGAMLSGGLDSSLIVALMARRTREPVKTFAIGFRGVGDVSELGDARRVSEALGTEHHEIELPLSTGREALEHLAWHMDEPVRSLSAFGFLALSELAASEVTVALSGQGADELFAGYRKHLVMSFAGAWSRVPGPMRALAAAVARRGPGDVPRLAEALQAPDPVTRLLASSGLMRPEVRSELFAGALAEHADAARQAASRHMDGALLASPLAAGLFLDAQLGLVDDMLHYFDRVSMAHSLEVRVPFLDHQLVELAACIPDRLKVQGRDTKHVLRAAARGLVPDFVLAKPKLGFFAASTSHWLEADGGSLVDEVLLAPDARCGELIQPALLTRVIREWREGADHTQFLLAVLLLELWLSSYLPRAFDVARSAPVAERAYDVSVPLAA